MLIVFFQDKIIVLSLIIGFFLWFKYGKDDQVVETVEFYPPNGFNSLEVAYLHKGKAESNDITSLLIYLANKGYVKISEIEEKNLFIKSKTFQITKIKEYDGNNSNEREFFDGLFKTGNVVTESDLYDKFYKTINIIKASINNKKIGFIIC